MITEGNLATAQIAQMFGSELLKVQESARTDSGASPQIVNIDPKSFLVNSRQNQKVSAQANKSLLEMLQREAEMAYPLPPASNLPHQPPTQQQPIEQPNQPTFVPLPEKTTAELPKNQSTISYDVLERINSNLEKIANAIVSLNINYNQNEINNK